MAQTLNPKSQKDQIQTLEEELNSLQSLVKTFQSKIAHEKQSSIHKSVKTLRPSSSMSLYNVNKLKQFSNSSAISNSYFKSTFLNNKCKSVKPNLNSAVENDFRYNKYTFFKGAPVSSNNYQNHLKVQTQNKYSVSKNTQISSVVSNKLTRPNALLTHKYVNVNNVEQKKVNSLLIKTVQVENSSFVKKDTKEISGFQSNTLPDKSHCNNFLNPKSEFAKTSNSTISNPSKIKTDCAPSAPLFWKETGIENNNKEKKCVLSKYKVVNKNNLHVRKELFEECKNKEKCFASPKSKLSNSKIFQTAKFHNRMYFNNSPKSIHKKTLVKQMNNLGRVNENYALAFKLKKSASKVSFKVKSPALSEAKKLISNKYKIVNKNKVFKKKLSAKKNNSLKSLSVYSKYKIVNRKNECCPSLLFSPVKNEAILNRTNLKIIDNSTLNFDSQNQTSNVMKISSTKDKINQLKHLKQHFKQADSEPCNLLNDFTPDELVAMDTESLLKLSALLKSPKLKYKRRSLVKQSKYKLVRKQSSLVNQTAQMIKTKYKITSRKSIKNWKSPFKGTDFRFRNKQSWYVNSPYKRNSNICIKKSSLLKNNRYKKTNSVIIGNNRYHISRTKLIKTGRKSLTLKQSSKLSSRKVDYFKKYSTPNSDICSFASRVLHRSIQTACASAAKKKQWKKSNLYCMFFNRFGKCNRATNCPFVHDPSKIAVCTRYLRGTCKVDNCPFSHEKSPGKMAICSYFLQGLCREENCPYRHEQLQPDAKLCKQFVQGYCSLGIKCEKAHILICPKYFRGECDKGKTCLYPHPPKRDKKSKTIDQLEINSNIVIFPEKKETEFLENEEDCDEVIRYFELKSVKESKQINFTNYNSEFEKTSSEVTFCPPQKDKNIDCPLFIPL